ncbi:MAG: hypothetical protein CVU41_15220 [Chloroflexi bacterium HGW-Chloroflexi-3]|nr:MAG: hypothetical protein CVU41_15220 [Chloroflexi bacterium HGW-Chloroflexi-3]
MNIYEDKYLREKVNRIIARQREGKIIIAAYKDGSVRQRQVAQINRTPHTPGSTICAWRTYSAEPATAAMDSSRASTSRMPPSMRPVFTLACARRAEIVAPCCMTLSVNQCSSKI